MTTQFFLSSSSLQVIKLKFGFYIILKVIFLKFDVKFSPSSKNKKFQKLFHGNRTAAKTPSRELIFFQNISKNLSTKLGLYSTKK